MKKMFSILMVAFAMTAMVACGGSDEKGGNNGGGNNGTLVDPQDKSLEGTSWQERCEYDEGDYYFVKVSFLTGSRSTYALENYHADGTPDSGADVSLTGSYTFDGTDGTFKMKRTDISSDREYDGVFYLEGNILHTNFVDEPHQLTKVQ